VLASAILVTPSRDLAERVSAEIARRVETLSRAPIIAQSLASRSGAVIVSISTKPRRRQRLRRRAPCLLLRDPGHGWAESATRAASSWAKARSRLLGDYVAGPSHVMPTGGTARSPRLNVLDFVKITSVIGLDPRAAAELSRAASVLARAEALTAHAAAAEARIARESAR